MTDKITSPAPQHALPPLPTEELFFTEDLGLGDTAHHTGYTADQMRDYARAAMAAATPAPATADHATVEQWEAALTAVMPSDFKDWHQNSRREWPNIAAHVIGNLRQREDEAWATVERLTATAPAPATGKPGLQVEQAPAVPAGAEPVSLAAAVRLGLEYAREALATHDQRFANHPATALERGSIVADIATMEASLASLVAGPSFSSCSAGGCPDKRGCDAAQHCLYTAPKAPQQAGHIPTVEDIDAQDWAGMDGATAYQVIERHGEDWSHIGRLMTAWLDANRAPGMEDENEALDLLDDVFSAYEDGAPCTDTGDDDGSFIGNAVRLDDETFHRCVALLKRRRPRPGADSDTQVTSTKKERP